MASPLTCAVPWCAGHGSRVGSFRDDDCVGTGGGEAHQADSTLIVAPRRVGRDPRFPASRAVFRPTGGLPRAMRRDATATPSTASPSTLSLAASRCSKREASVRCPGTSWCSRGGFATLTVGWNGSSAKRRHHGRPATTRSRRCIASAPNSIRYGNAATCGSRGFLDSHAPVSRRCSPKGRSHGCAARDGDDARRLPVTTVVMCGSWPPHLRHLQSLPSRLAPALRTKKEVHPHE